MRKLRYCISAMRLRTLPLSISGVSLGLLLAVSDYHVSWAVALSVIVTAVMLQILSNVSNELGDALKGTDTPLRKGPVYGIISGKLTVRDLKVMIWTFALLSAASGLVMIWLSYGTLLCLDALVLMLLGFAAISSAMKYTLGKSPYGYRGLGDIYVFVFFGVVAVLGSYLVAAHTIPTWYLILPAVSIGAFSVAVLNVNNIRDMETDRPTRVTLPLKMGETWAKVYQTVLVLIGWVAMCGYAYSRMYSLWHYLFVLTLPLFIWHLAGVWRGHGHSLDRMLPLLVAATFFFALLGGLGFVLFLF